MIPADGQERAAPSTLPKQRKLTKNEHLTEDASLLAPDSDEVYPIETEICGVGASSEYAEEYMWWLLAALLKDCEANRPLVVGCSLSLQVSGHVDAILLCVRRRLLVIRLRHSLTRFRVEEHVVSKSDHIGALLFGRLFVEGKKVQLVGFHGALQALHVYRALNLHMRMVDLSADPDAETYMPAHMRIERTNLFRSHARKVAKLKKADFRFVAEIAFDFADYLPVATEAVAAFLYAHHALLPAQLASTLVNTSNVPLRDLDLGARLVAVFHSVTLLQPELQKVDFSEVTSGDAPGTALVHCERYSTRLTPQSRQTVNIELQDGTVVEAVASRTVGKKSEITMRDGSVPDTADIAAITVQGLEDADYAENKAIEFWYRVLRASESGGDQHADAEKALDPAGLFYPLFYDNEPLHRGTKRKVLKFGPPDEACRFSTIQQSQLDPYQRRAAMALLKPIKTPSDRLTVIHGPPGTGKTTVIAQVCRQWLKWLEDRAEGSSPSTDAKDTTQAGPLVWDVPVPGLTDKKAKQAKKGKSSEPDPTTKTQKDAQAPPVKSNGSSLGTGEPSPSIWCVCQSNAAVKNIAASLRKQQLPFRILVSESFYREWHEHYYTELQEELIVTVSLKDVDEIRRRMTGASIILSTLSCLSSPRMEKGKVFDVRPIHALIVDEASQVVLGAYPHLFARHAQTLGRVGFFGDHKQLAPFGSDTIDGIESIFELKHLEQRAIMLSCCYRLPRTLCSFVSEQVYDAKLLSVSAKPLVPLHECVRFFDVDAGFEEKGATSFINKAEAASVCAFVGQLATGADFDDTEFRVLTPYLGQRDLLESELKRLELPWQDRVFTVDSFQGQEADVVILSLVRDGRAEDGHTAGFLTNQRRSNVLITRTKAKMIVFTSKRFMVDDGAKGKETLIGVLAEQVGKAGWSDIDELAEDGSTETSSVKLSPSRRGKDAANGKQAAPLKSNGANASKKADKVKQSQSHQPHKHHKQSQQAAKHQKQPQQPAKLPKQPQQPKHQQQQSSHNSKVMSGAKSKIRFEQLDVE